MRKPLVEGLRRMTKGQPAISSDGRRNVPLTLVADDVIDSVFVHALPGELLVRQMPLEHLPKHHRARKHVYLVVVFRMRVPELGGLPVNGAD